jgi:hypothetical protein
VLPLTLSPNPAPTLTTSEAMAGLCHTNHGWVFLTDPISGRGRLLYRRYTLVEPTDPPIRA